MNLLAHLTAGFESAVLPLAAALLLEELTYAGLVRLLLAPRPDARKIQEHKNQQGDGK